MAIFLKQSTAVVVNFGPAVDKTNGVDLETGLVTALDHASTGILLSKNGGTLTIRHASVTATTYDAHGFYKVTLDSTDTASLGVLKVVYTDAATCLPIWLDCMVMPANIWDSLYGADFLQVDQAQWLGVTVAAVDTNGYPKVTIKDGTGQGEILTTSGKVDGVILSDTLTTYTGNTVQTGDSFARIGATGSGLSAIPWNAAWDAEVQSEATDALNAYDPPTHTELTAELATADDAVLAALSSIASTLATIASYVDTEIAAIKAKTDSLTFSAAGMVDANVQRINDVPITGDGSLTPFGV